MQPIDEPTQPEETTEDGWHRLQIQVTPEQYRWLNERRFKRGKSIAHIVREIVDQARERKD